MSEQWLEDKWRIFLRDVLEGEDMPEILKKTFRETFFTGACLATARLVDQSTTAPQVEELAYELSSFVVAKMVAPHSHPGPQPDSQSIN